MNRRRQDIEEHKLLLAKATAHKVPPNRYAKEKVPG